jgi:hypothetical protein
MPDLTSAQLLAATAADMRGEGGTRPAFDAVGQAIADWLDANARYDGVEQTRMDGTELGKLAPMLKVCNAWWASRGIDPTALEA